MIFSLSLIIVDYSVYLVTMIFSLSMTVVDYSISCSAIHHDGWAQMPLKM
jgi:hypothetical protein